MAVPGPPGAFCAVYVRAQCITTTRFDGQHPTGKVQRVSDGCVLWPAASIWMPGAWLEEEAGAAHVCVRSTRGSPRCGDRERFRTGTCGRPREKTDEGIGIRSSTPCFGLLGGFTRCLLLAVAARWHVLAPSPPAKRNSISGASWHFPWVCAFLGQAGVRAVRAKQARGWVA